MMAPAQEQGRVLERVGALLGQVVVPAGAVTGVLYYFGYVRERAFYSYFGIPVGSLDLTTADYVLRSSQAVFLPLALLLLGSLVAMAVHHLVMAYAPRVDPRWWRRAWLIVGLVGCVLVLLGAAALYRIPPLSPEAGAVSLGCGAAVLEYAVWLAGTDDRLTDNTRDSLHAARWPRRVVLVGVVLVALFWWTANVAHANGLAAARAIEGSLVLRGEAVVLSHRQLVIDGHGVEEEVLSGTRSGYGYRYTGLRVLLHTGEHWVLLPAAWRHDNGDSVVLLRDDADGIRVDVRP